MATISLCMIAKNEANTLARCLDSVKEIADEIIIVDTGSSDQTKEIANQYTSNVYDFKWVDDFSAARNFSFSKASCDYILWLDCDDVILEEDYYKFLDLKRTIDFTVDSYFMHYNLSMTADGKVTNRLRRNRLVKRSKNFKWKGAIHEYLSVNGTIIPVEIAVTHKSTKTAKGDRNIKIYRKQMQKGIPFTPRDWYYYANECFEHQLFDDAIHAYETFIATKQGWIEDNIKACLRLGECSLAKGEKEKSITETCKAFLYDSPRAEHCCFIANVFFNQKEYEKAIFWYELATTLTYEKQQKNGAFINYAAYTWLPHLQLCVCYDRLGKHEIAFKHNETAKKLNPTHPAVLYNYNYFKKILSNDGDKHANKLE